MNPSLQISRQVETPFIGSSATMKTSAFLMLCIVVKIYGQRVPLNCDFIEHGGPYTCLLFGINFNDSTSVWFSFGGGHDGVLNNQDVKSVQMTFSDAPFVFITNLYQVYENLIDFQIIGAGLTRIVRSDFQTARLLRSLTIMGNPKLKSIPAFAFEGLFEIRSIQLDSNGIETIEEFAFGRYDTFLWLQFLSLNNNNISYLPHNLLSHLRQLRRFFIADNNLLRIDARLLSSILLVGQINFSRNKINAIERNFFAPWFRRIQFAGFEGNECVDESWIDQDGVSGEIISQGLEVCFRNFESVPEDRTFYMKLYGSMMIRHMNGTEIVRI